MNMMNASMQGVLAFQKGLGCVHSLEPRAGGSIRACTMAR